MTDKTHTVEAYKDESTLRELYQNKKLSMEGVADELDATKSKVRYWMEKHGIERRGRKEAMNVKYSSPNLSVGGHGYERFQHQYDNEAYRLQHHRLLAVAEYGWEAVQGKVIHHKNGVPWDNRPENLEIMGRDEHATEHHDPIPISTQLAMFALYESTDLTHREVAELFGKSTTNSTTVVKRVRDNGVNGVLS